MFDVDTADRKLRPRPVDGREHDVVGIATLVDQGEDRRPVELPQVAPGTALPQALKARRLGRGTARVLEPPQAHECRGCRPLPRQFLCELQLLIERSLGFVRFNNGFGGRLRIRFS